ncbi:hypothetical protein K504DRAFT_197839 [Pleomassaria siparia CBS 279.74]|uniref:Rab-GAP TBC domain-containing protein n=1 Tax=Pleomassaria siparia CBS 279.74 TaxID=1314801 RepID=A0A6G1KI50_9PLEO|nr:hypothetical protein K504DRAFT_197839 [Pleomassaria siparia CBS 279.74]
MGEPFIHAGTSGVLLQENESTIIHQPSPGFRPPGLAYRAPHAEFTPPASPQPTNPYSLPAGKKSFGSLRAKHPGDLQMDPSPATAYSRPTYSPSPSSSPPLPPALPSPNYPRQRAPSLLRHAAAYSPLGQGYPRAEQSAASPTYPTAPAMSRQGSGQGPTSDPRVFFNPLASNPVHPGSPSWDLSREDLTYGVQSRARGPTSSAQALFNPNPNPPLRATTSIPDYGQFRGTDRRNPSGAYRPDRGGVNWSHNDLPPLRQFRPEEARSSFRSGWTNGSSFVDASGTERSSMATGRSSVSDNRVSTYSGERSDERDAGSDATLLTEALDDDDVRSAVDDVIDAYCYDDELYVQDQAPYDSPQEEHTSSSPINADQETSGLPHLPNPSQDSYQPLNFPEASGGQARLYPATTGPSNEFTSMGGNNPSDKSHGSNNLYNGLLYAKVPPEQQKDQYLPLMEQLSPLQLQYSPVSIQSPQSSHPRSTDAGSNPWRRSSDDQYRQGQTMAPGVSHGRMQSTTGPRQGSKSFDRQRTFEIQQDLNKLPQLPPSKSRLSRQDWASIQAYSRKSCAGTENSGQPNDVSPKRPILAAQQPYQKTFDSLPEVDADEAFPRRASTSVFDRRSTFLDLGSLQPSPPTKSKTTDFGDAKVTVKQRLAQSLKVSTTAVQRDRYGFKKATDKVTVQEYDAWFGKYNEYVTRRRGKWVTLLEKHGLPTTNPTQFPERSEKVRRYTRKGYPPEWRGAMWWFYSGGQYKIGQPEFAGLYSELLERVNNGELNKDDREAIERDLDRTFPDNIHFRPDPTSEHPDIDEEPRLIKDLREVLSCFALNNPSIGYCQSLNFIAGLLLLFLKNDTERAFVMLTIITEYHLPGAHARSLANIEVNVLMMLIKDYLPKVWNSINDTDLVNNGPGSHAHPDSKFQRQPTVALSCTSWFMSVFVGVLPIETVLRVWDAFLYEGPRALFRYALAIFKLGETEIRKFRPGDGEVFMAVQNLPRRCIDPNVLHDIAYVKKGFGSLNQHVIDQKRQFWTEQNERAKRSNGPLSPGIEEDVMQVTDIEKDPKLLGGLRRKASRRFLRRKLE